MTTAKAAPNHPVARGVLAISAGFIAVVVLSVVTDTIMQSFGFFVAGSASIGEVGPFAFALIYRSAFGIVGSWVAARMAPSHPMRYALIVGGIGLFLGILGAVTMTGKEFGPEWYPWALVVATMPCAWAGGLFAQQS
jgi:hypothetical protein